MTIYTGKPNLSVSVEYRSYILQIYGFSTIKGLFSKLFTKIGHFEK